MPATIRLNDNEQEKIRIKAVEINKLRLNRGMQPLRDSELVHKLLELSMACVKTGKDGDLYLEP